MFSLSSSYVPYWYIRGYVTYNIKLRQHQITSVTHYRHSREINSDLKSIFSTYYHVLPSYTNDVHVMSEKCFITH